MAEWDRFKIGSIPPSETFEQNDYKSLSVVRHIAHIQESIRILEDGSIRPSLIKDKSRLSNTRTCVSWVSPNSWALGSIYGNVSFEFDWGALIENRKLYWVEARDDYKIAAYRFLISEKNPNQLDVKPYDASRDTGPIFFNGQDWYWNGKFTAELMIDDDLALTSCLQISFDPHHRSRCSKYGTNCVDLGRDLWSAGSTMMSAIIGRKLAFARELLSSDGNLTKHAKPAIQCLLDELTKNARTINNTSIYNEAILRASLVAFGYGDVDLCNELLGIIDSETAIKEGFVAILGSFFSIEKEDIKNQMG